MSDENTVPIDLDSDDDLFPSSQKEGVKKSNINKETPTSKPISVEAKSPSIYPVDEVPLTPPANSLSPEGVSFNKLKVSDDVKSSGDEYYIQISIGDPRKVGDRMNAYIAYRCTTKTNYPHFSEKLFSVTRRFSDFLGLFQKLMEKHLQYGRFVPQCPEKNFSGTTRIKIGKEDSSEGTEFLERRRAALERFMNRVVSHSAFRTDPEVRDFLEREQLPKASHTSAISGASLVKRFSSAFDAVSTKAKYVENDPWFESKTIQIENIDRQFRRLHSIIETLVQSRKDISAHTATFAKGMALLGNSEEHMTLSRALSQLSEVEEKMEHIYAEQANNDFFLFSELFKDYIGLITSVKEAFAHRIKIFTNLQITEAYVVRKKEQEPRVKPEKLSAHKEDIREAEEKVENYKRDFENITDAIKKEMEKFEEVKIKDFKVAMTKYLESLLHSQQKIVVLWENYLPEAKSVQVS